MKFLSSFLAAILVCTGLFAQTETYSRVRVYANEQGLAGLNSLGICTDHGTVKPGYWFETDLSATELSLIQAHGYSTEILIDDVSKFYADRNDPSSLRYVPPTTQSIGCNPPPVYSTPSNFTLGSMGGYFTYQEVLNHLDNMASLFPNLITVKTALPNQTTQGRPVYWVKISDNANTSEPEPQVLYTAVHHAREPASVSQLIFYMYYLLENYNSDQEVKYLVDNSEMYFVPLVNPDGYVRNQTTNPNGGGMWRKNRRNNGDGTYGVDLNRNYAYSWGFDNQGSSPNTSSDTYRGPSAASEPETQDLQAFCNAHNFKIAMNYHTYGNLLIYPWGYGTSLYTPDSAQFTAYGQHLTTYNHWSYGTPDQTVLYTANGTSDDWMYGDANHPKVMAMTSEAGRSDEGFWPPQNRIIPICGEAVWENLHVCHLALKYAVATDAEQNYLPGLSGYLNYKLQRLGMDAPATYTVSIIPLSSYITSVGAPKTYSTLSLMQQADDSISFTLSGTTPNGQLLQYIIAVDNGSYTRRDTITKRYGTPVIVFQSNGSSMTGWTSTTGWGLSTAKYHSANSSITDSPGGNYPTSANTKITTASQLNLTDALSAQLTFWGTWDLETNFDYVEAQASNDNGNTWTPLCGKWTKAGNGYQDLGQPLYDAFNKQWLYEEAPLDNYIGQNILIRFNLVSDNGSEYDGFYFDDLKVEKIVNTPSGTNPHAVNGFVLSQNMPNPASQGTSIAYSLPGTLSTASLVIYNTMGQVVCTGKLDRNAGVISVDLSALSSGMYYYCIEAGNERSGMMKMMVGK
jgi:hypothetical protein